MRMEEAATAKRIAKKKLTTFNFLTKDDRPAQVEFEATTLRLRAECEAIHVRKEATDTFCAHCGRPAPIWLDSTLRHTANPAKCQRLAITYGGWIVYPS